MSLTCGKYLVRSNRKGGSEGWREGGLKGGREVGGSED